MSEAVGEEGEEGEKEEGAPSRPQRAVDVSKDPGELLNLLTHCSHFCHFFFPRLPFGPRMKYLSFEFYIKFCSTVHSLKDWECANKKKREISSPANQFL